MDSTLTAEEQQRLRERIARIPISNTLSFREEEIRRGFCALSMERDTRFDGIFETIHGGLLMTLADSAAAFAILTIAGADARIATIEMSIRFLAPARDRAVARATVLKSGKRIAFCTVDIHDGGETLLGHATVTYMIVDGR
jgi:uncharacterized protein (TIGR00369 family)